MPAAEGEDKTEKSNAKRNTMSFETWQIRSAIAAKQEGGAPAKKNKETAKPLARTAGFAAQKHDADTNPLLGRVPEGGVKKDDNFVSADRVWRTGMLSVNDIQQALEAKNATEDIGGSNEKQPPYRRVPGAATGKINTGGAKTETFSTADVRGAFKKEKPGRTAGFTLADARDWRTATATFSGAAVRAANLSKQDKPNYNAFRKQKRARLGIFSMLGTLFYTIGFAAEYHFLQLWRLIRDGLIFITQILIWFFGGIAGWLKSFFIGAANDFKAPFKKFSRKRRQLKRVRARAAKQAAHGYGANTYFGVGVKTSLGFAANIIGVLMPVLAVVVMVLVIQSVINVNYVLAVEVNGEVLGYVSDQSVVEKAKGQLRERIKISKDQEIKDWQVNPKYSITWSDNFTTTQQLANNMLRSSAGEEKDIVEATGLYLNDELFAVTTEGERLRAYLDNILNKQRDTDNEDAVVDFAIPVECEPDNEDLYFASSVESYDELIKKLSSNVSDEVIFTANGEISMNEIAHINGITVDELISRNLFIDYEDEEEAAFIPAEGTELLIKRAQPFLQVQKSVRVQSTEVVPFATEENETADLARNVRNVVQKGEDGLQEVWDDYIYIDGELVSRQRVDSMTVVLTAPVPEIVNVGTYSFANRRPGESTAAYMFPVPDSTYSYRGFSSYHAAQDINAPTGMPIYACQDGVVTTAGWHWSYGWHVVIDHPDGYQTLYAHCSSLNVEAGQAVRQGDYIAAVGSTGTSTGPHCHLEIRKNGRALNPLDFITPPEKYNMWGR